jgi:plastocyanin
VPTQTPVVAHYAKRYTIADRWFHAAFGDSWHNHFWLLCACTPQWYGTPPPTDEIILPTITTPGGYFVKGTGSSTELRSPEGTLTWYLVEQPETRTCDAPPHTPTPTPTPPPGGPAHCVPLQTLPNIGDRLVGAGLDWGWYRGDVEGVLPQFLNYACGTTGYARYLRVLQPTSTPTSTPTATAASAPLVSIVDFGFQPRDVTIFSGTTVRWSNSSLTRSHTTTSDGAVWSSGVLGPGQSFDVLFGTPGTFGYHCDIHPSMTGTINVS